MQDDNNSDYKRQEIDKKLSIGEASEYLGISIDTLRRWEKKGKIQPLRSPGGHRYFNRKDLDELFGRKYERDPETKPRQISAPAEPAVEEVVEIEKVEVEEKFENLEPVDENDLDTIPPEFLRPARNIEIPPAAPIRIIKESYHQDIAVEIQQSIPETNLEKVSVLTPPEEIPIPSLPSQETAKAQSQKNELKEEVFISKKVAIISTLVIIIIIFLGGLFLYLWQTSKQILSPIP